jgi:phospholipid/cholesterol/gamma-HCH transport system permease protein
MSEAPSLSATQHGDRFGLLASGSWTAAHAGQLERLTGDELAGHAGISIGMRNVSAFDTFGAWILERLIRSRAAAGRQTLVVGLRDEFQGLFEDMHRVRLEEAEERAAQKPILPGQELKQAVDGLARGVLPFFGMLGAIGLAAARTIRHPGSFRLTSAVYQLDRVGWQAAAIILLITFLIGCIIAQQGFFSLPEVRRGKLRCRHSRAP